MQSCVPRLLLCIGGDDKFVSRCANVFAGLSRRDLYCNRQFHHRFLPEFIAGHREKAEAADHVDKLLISQSVCDVGPVMVKSRRFPHFVQVFYRD